MNPDIDQYSSNVLWASRPKIKRRNDPRSIDQYSKSSGHVSAVSHEPKSASVDFQTLTQFWFRGREQFQDETGSCDCAETKPKIKRPGLNFHLTGWLQHFLN